MSGVYKDGAALRDSGSTRVEESRQIRRMRLLENIDTAGFRANVGIIVADALGAVLIGGRIGQSGWQFPQGGIRHGESPEEAMYRELEEEIGLCSADVQVIGRTRDWLHYRLPEQFVRRNASPVCIGQKQRWFLLRMTGPESRLRLDASPEPEFDRWRWVGWWEPVRTVIYFKRHVYARALQELAPLQFGASPPRPEWWRSSWDRGTDG